MLKPSDLTKAELLQVVEMLAFGENKYYLDRALGRIEMQRNDAHFERSRKLIDEERKHYAAYFDLLRPYEGKPIADVIKTVFWRYAPLYFLPRTGERKAGAQHQTAHAMIAARSSGGRGPKRHWRR